MAAYFAEPNRELKMKLKSYIYEIGLRTSEFAELVHVTPDYMRAIISGRKKPSVRLVKMINELTGGDVQLEPSDKTKAGRKMRMAA